MSRSWQWVLGPALLALGACTEPAQRSSSAVTRQPITAPGLVAAYGFEEGTGTVLGDATGHGHDAVLTGQEWVTGRYGSALRFSNTFISVPSSSELILTDALTLSAWVYPETDTQMQVILMKEGGGGFTYELCASSFYGVEYEPSVYLTHGWEEHGVHGGSTPPNVWTHVAATYDSENLRLYIDGSEVGSLPFDESINGFEGPLNIGGSGVLSAEQFLGRIDEVRIYDRALTPQEITDDIQTPIGESTPDTTDPSVILDAPANGSIVAGPVALAATASDNVGVVSVKFLVDGVLVAEDLSAPFAVSWDSTTVASGAHTITAQARDIAGNTADSSVSVSVAAGALVAAYAFDEGSGSAVHDQTGFGNDTVLDGQTWVAGKYGTALAFDQNFLTVADAALLDLTSSLTLSAWVRPDGPHVNWPAVLFKEREVGGAYGLFAEFSGIAPSLCVGPEGESSCAHGGGTPAGVWTHLAGTYDGTTLRAYVNGALAGELAKEDIPDATTQPLHIGGSSQFNGFFTGAIDEIRIYARVLSEAEINADMGTPMGCTGPLDDGNPCTLDACEPGVGVTHTPAAAGASCADANACNGSEVCDATATCTNGTPPTVDDGNPCTTDSCDPPTGVAHTPVAAGTSCGDTDACNGAETCNAVGTCVPGTAPVVDDGNPCTADACSPTAGATHTPVAAGTSCADANACNGAETCDAAGSCTAGTPVSCVASDQCHDAGTCDPATGACTNPTRPDGTSCADATACNGSETCQSGTCTPGTPPTVDDGNPCTSDTCDASTGVAHTPVAVGTSCADSDTCNGAETCNSVGACVSGTAPTVDDGNPCTADACSPAAGVTHTPVAAGTSCADANACNGAETCDAGGSCTAGTSVSCVASDQCHDAGTCDPATGLCSNPAKADGAACTDGNACTVGETCQSAACAAGTPIVLDDANPCTDDACDPIAGISHSPRPVGASCSDADLCNGNETCDAAGVCQPGTPVSTDGNGACSVGSCNPTTGVVTYAPATEGTECFLDACTIAECNAAGECTSAGSTVVDDGDPCTVEWCDPELGPQEKTCAPLDRSVGTTLHEAMKWIYSEPNPPQVGVAPGTIVVERAAALRGRITARDGSPLPGVTVSILEHAELGWTTTRLDGYFDLVVNGGGTLVLLFEKDGYLSIQREAKTIWGEHAALPDAVMIPSDPVVTRIDLAAPGSDVQVVQGSVVVDEDGPRQGTLLIPEGTGATMHLADGSEVELTTMDIRITEFTVGPNGPNAMPAPLPPESRYTYAFEVNADEAVLAGAPSITFSSPLPYYVDNFLGFPAGTPVPLGALDRDASAWKREESGVVLDILSESNGRAEVDLTGDGIADTGSALSEHSITDSELQTLADLYEPGRSLWRVRLPHFTTPWDCNWGGGPPDDAERPNNPPPDNDDEPFCPSEVAGASTIECEAQVLRENLPIAGTPLSLNYSSLRVPGRKAAYEVKLQLSGASLPVSVRRIDLNIYVAGRSFRQSFPAAPNQSTTFIWDGLDAYGRRPQGAQELTGTIEYVYEFGYSRNCCFGYNGNGTPITGSLARSELYFPQGIRAKVGVFDASATGLGAWTLDGHHFHELATQRLQLGSGRVESAASLPPVVTKVVPGSEQAFSGQIVVAPDGTIFTGIGGVVWKATPGLAAVRFAGHHGLTGYAGDGLAATDPSVRLSGVQDLALGPDGSLYIADHATSSSDLVRRVRPDGIIETFAGVPGQRTTAIVDGSLATEQPLASPRHLAVAPDGTLFISTLISIVRVAPDGTIDRVAGKLVPPGTTIPQPPFPVDGTPARDIHMQPAALALDPQGTLYASVMSCSPNGPCGFGARILRFVDGLTYHVAGDGCVGTTCVSAVDGLPARNTRISAEESLAFDAQGQLHFIDSARVRTITPTGIVATVAGRASGGIPFSNGVPATAASIVSNDVAFGPNGLHLTATTSGSPAVLRVHLMLPGETGSAFLVGARGADAFHLFDAVGRHLSTRHSLTSAELTRYAYSNGNISTITDEAGLVTTVERDAAGRPTAIVAPFGQRTELGLDGNGYLAEVRAPNGDVASMTYSPDGLLETFTNARGVTSSMQYDGGGRLVLDSDPVGGSHTLSRTEAADGSWTVERSTALGRTTLYSTAPSSVGTETKTITNPAGHQALISKGSDQTMVATRPDGTIVTTSEAPDARLGLNAPLQSRTTRTPSGLTQVETTTREYSSLNPADLTDFFDTTTRTLRNGRPWSTRFTKSTSTFTVTSPAGRTSTRVIDSLGRTIRTQLGGLSTPTEFAYDASGRLERITQGGRITTNAYFPPGTPFAGFLSATTDPILDVTSYTRDAIGRTLTETRPGASTAFGWDPLNNLTSVTPPGKPEHVMTYTPVNLLETYAPPSAGLATPNTGYTYDLDRMLRTETRPTGELITRTPDSAGRLDTVAIPGGLIDYEYYPPATPSGAGKTSDIRGPYGVDLQYTYDGSLTTSTTWSGDVNSSVAWQYNNDFNKIFETVTAPSGSGTTAFGYDNDQLLTCASPTTCNPAGSDALQLIRSPQNGLVTGITLGSTSETLTYNSVGELATQSATFGSTPLLYITYHGAGDASRDALGRIVQKTEVIGGVTKVYRYTYDALRRLTDVTIDGVLEEHFEYDANGNRTLGYNRTAGTTWTGTYDDQDRLLSYGPFDYTYTANGELETKTNRETDEEWLFQYDVLGNLLAVGLPDGRLVEYLVDGLGRRVGKKIDGVLLKQWVYRDALKPVAELDGAGNLVAEFVYGSKPLAPDYVRRGGATYRVVSDHLGSPRYLVNVSNSADVPLMASYTSFGERTGTAPDWMLLGFAGGAYDADTRLVRFGARDYDALTGRWVSKDPIRFDGGVASLYVYAKNDPLQYGDADGRNPLLVAAVAELLCLQTVSIVAAGIKDSSTRHCYASCVGTRYCGALPTLGAGFIHEAGTNFTDDWREDLEANWEGVKNGINPFNDCMAECKKTCP